MVGGGGMGAGVLVVLVVVMVILMMVFMLVVALVSTASAGDHDQVEAWQDSPGLALTLDGVFHLHKAACSWVFTTSSLWEFPPCAPYPVCMRTVVLVGTYQGDSI